MTSTNIYQGMDTESKPSSRVLAPPGGGSSNIFGTSQPHQAAPKKEAAPAPAAAPAPTSSQPSQQTERAIRAAPKQAFNPITGEPYEVAEPKKKQETPASNDANTTEANKEESKEGKENEAQAVDSKSKPAPAAENKERTSTRIAQPPGGKSSGLW